MNQDVVILRAILRLARKRELPTVPALLVRTGGTAAELRNAIRRLAGLGLVARAGDSVRLTMEGFAITVATLPDAAPKRKRAATKEGAKENERSKRAA